MKTLIPLLFLLLANALPAQIVGNPYSCCGQNSGLIQIGDNNVSTSAAPFLTSLTSNFNTVAAFLLISGAEDSNPWPLDPSAGWIFANPDPAHYIGTVNMLPFSSGVEWFYQWQLPADPSLAGTLLFFQAAKVTTTGGWSLTNGWTTELL